MCQGPGSTLMVRARSTCGCPTASLNPTGSGKVYGGSPVSSRPRLSSGTRSARAGPTGTSGSTRQGRRLPEPGVARATGTVKTRSSAARTSRAASAMEGTHVTKATDLRHVLVLAGGLSPEREVSLRSGHRVCDALRENGVDAITADADAALIPAIAADPPDAVFPAIHGACGEDGAVREVLDLLDVPFVGAVATACRFAFDKPTAKALAAAAGLTTPEAVTLPKETFHDLGANAVLDRIVARLGLPLFVKPSRGGSALGAGPVWAAEELPAAMMGCFAYGDTALIERFVTGTEVAVSVIDF